VHVEVKLFAGLRDRLPSAQRGRARLELAPGTTLGALIERLEIAREQAQMVLVNGLQVSRAPGVRERRVLADGDVVAIFPPVAGG